MVGTWHLKTDVLSSKKKSWNGTAALFWFMTWPPAELQVVMIPNNAGIHEGPITFASCHLNKPFWAPLSPSHTFSMSKSWVCLSAPVFCAQRACGTRWGGRWSCHWGRESNWRSKETRRRTEFWWVDACCRQPASSSGQHSLSVFVSQNVLSSDFRLKDGTSVMRHISPFFSLIPIYIFHLNNEASLSSFENRWITAVFNLFSKD